MPYHAEPLRPSLRWPHVEWWVPLMVACSTLQRANPDFLLSPLDLSGAQARMCAIWDEGPKITVVPEGDTGTEQLRGLLESAVPGRQVRAPLPGHGREFWAPPEGAPARTRYAWLLDQFSVDSTHWRMKFLNLVAVEADHTSASVDVILERLDAPGTVTARVPLLAGKELVGAPDWIASRVRTALAEGAGEALPAHPDQPAFLVELARWCRGRKRSPEWSDRYLG